MDMHRDFRGFEHLHDVRIRTQDGHEFPAHRVLLAMRSEYFREVFCNSSTEQAVILVPRIQGSIMEIVLEYIYTGKLTFTKYNIRDILVAAYILDIEELLKRTRMLAISNLTMENCVLLLSTGTKIDSLGILKACSRFIEVNFGRIVDDQNSKFEEMTVQTLERLLSSDSVNVLNERQIWRAIELWIKKFPGERKKYIKNLIACMRFTDSDPNLSVEVLDHPLIKEDSSYVEIAKIAAYRLPVPKHRIPKMFFFCTKFFISSFDYDEGIKMFITYDENIDIWRNISSKIFRPDVVLHGSGSLVVMFETTMNVIYSFDILSKTWSNFTPPTIPRREYYVVKLGSHIYALGGFAPGEETDEIITTAERYNFDSENWEFVQSHYGLTQGAAATIDNNIYIIGRIGDFYSEFLAAQIYNPETDNWRTINAPRVYRCMFALTVYKKQLYVVGGQNNEGYLKTVEVYDADKNIWSYFEDLPFPYFLPKSVIIQDVWYVCDNHSHYINDFRCPPVFWDEAYHQWQIVEASSPFCDLHMYQFCTIEDSAVIMEMKEENRHPGTKWDESPFFTHLNS